MRLTPGFEPHVCATGQHRELLDRALATFDVVPDFHMRLMRPEQSLGALTAKLMASLDAYLSDTQPDLVIVQGDTTTAFCGGLAAFYRSISVAHIEAGLRTHDPQSPFPEEFNRTAISRVTQYHFAPTEKAVENLLAERVPRERIYLTGNTGIDALCFAIDRNRRQLPIQFPVFHRMFWIPPARSCSSRCIVAKTRRGVSRPPVRQFLSYPTVSRTRILFCRCTPIRTSRTKYAGVFATGRTST